MGFWRALAYYSAFLAARILPRPMGNGVADLASRLAHRLKRAERAHVRRNVAALIGKSESSPEAAAAARRIYRNFGRSCADLLYESRSTVRPYVPDLQLPNIGLLRRALDKKRGVILICAHTGGWDLGAMALASRGYPLTVLADEPAAGTARLYRQARDRAGVQVIDPSLEPLTKCVRVLGRGGILGVMADRRFGPAGFEADLFGRTARLPQGAVRLAAISAAPILGATFRRRADGASVLRFFDGGSEECAPDLEALQERVAGLVRTMIAEAPEEWYCFEDAWK